MIEIKNDELTHSPPPPHFPQKIPFSARNERVRNVGAHWNEAEETAAPSGGTKDAAGKGRGRGK
jgi:hypothetical protein